VLGIGPDLIELQPLMAHRTPLKPLTLGGLRSADGPRGGRPWITTLTVTSIRNINVKL